MTLPDFARAALFVLNKGKNYKGEQIVEEEFFTDLVTPNQMLKDAFPDQYKFMAANGHYRSQFWVIDAEKKQFMMVGVYGQIAYFDYENEFALVGFGSYPIAKDPLLVQSIENLMDALLSALETEQPIAQPNINVLMLVDH